jgi:hypothetical protein
MFRKYTFSALLALAGCCVLPGVVTAGPTPFQGVHVETIIGGKTTLVFGDGDMPNYPVANFLMNDKVRKALDNAILKATVGTGAYNPVSQLSHKRELGTTELLQDGTIYTSSFLRANTLTFKVTTNTGILGGGLDPQFTITYDLCLIIRIKRDSTGNFLAKGEVKIINLRLDPGNLAADVAVAVDSVIKFFTGKDFIKQAEASILQKNVDVSGYVNAMLAPINQKLADARKAGLNTLTMKAVPWTKTVNILEITLSK